MQYTYYSNIGVKSSTTSRFPSLGIPMLDLEYPCWNTYVGYWNSYVGIPMSNIGIPTWVFQVQPRNSEAREPTTVVKE